MGVEPSNFEVEARRERERENARERAREKERAREIKKISRRSGN